MIYFNHQREIQKQLPTRKRGTKNEGTFQLQLYRIGTNEQNKRRDSFTHPAF